MGAGKKAVTTAQEMVEEVEKIAKSLGLSVEKNVKSGNTVWGTARKIKVVVEHKSSGRRAKRAGIECICQKGPGTANQKFFAKAADVRKYPFKGIVAYAGPGFKKEFCGVMDTYGAIPLEGLKAWLKLYYNMK